MTTYYEQQMSLLTLEQKRELWRQKAKDYRDNHPEKYKSYRKKLRSLEPREVKERRNEKQRERYRKQRDEKPNSLNPSYDNNVKYRHESWSKWVLSNIKKRCKLNNIPFDITPEDIPLPEYCPVFGMKLNPGERGYANKGEKRNWESPSVDRVVPELGYVKGNVRVISMRANTIKNNATADELEKVLNYVRANTQSS